jgi:2-keto-4-pentenoate hydratase/2-oxohepta-3-ene-1,7-dioic acid hydratase in catechol pathway
MKLLMFNEGGERRLGVGRDSAPDEIVDVAAAARGSESPAPPGDILGVIDGGDEGLARVAELAHGGEGVRRLADLTVLPPFDPPRGNVLAIGRNYLKHAEEGARARNEPVEPPTVFTKAITTIAGAHDDIRIDASVSTKIDWEVELGVVIGRRGVNIRRQDALNHVFGYTVLNDVTARDIQYEWGGQFFKGKSLDGFCPVGPWVLTRDEVPEVQDLHLRLTVNGVLKQDGHTADMIYPVDAIVEWLSKGMTLLPGMLIATGTPDGVGFARTPPEFLQPGDVMETEIEGIGVLRNNVVAAST